MGLAGVGVVSVVLGGSWSDFASYGGVLGLVAWVGYAALWRPYVDVTDGGVELRNVLRTIRLPWPAIQNVDGRYGLRLDTAYGPFVGWAAPAPAGRERLRGGDSEASAVVRLHLQRLTGFGYLDDARLERDQADVTWHWPEIAGGVLLLVLAVVGPLLS